MYFPNIKRIIGLAAVLNAAMLTMTSITPAQALQDVNEPDVPCTEVRMPAGNRTSMHTYAVGVQRYKWDGTSWVFVEPVARLYANDNYRGELGTHYAGPTWESNSGSKVIAARVAGCSVDPTAIDLLLLQAVSNEGHGPFKRVTYIQRLNTVGGKAPIAPGSIVGAVAEIPYTAEYYFYRAGN